MTGPGDPPINRLTDDDTAASESEAGGSDRAADENLVALRSRKDYIDVSPWRACPGEGRRDGRMRLWSQETGGKGDGSWTSEKHWRRDTRPAVWFSVEGETSGRGISDASRVMSVGSVRAGTTLDGSGV